MKQSTVYWVVTTILALGMLSGGLSQVLHIQRNVEGIEHLGYPVYFITIVGFWKIAGVIAIVIPRYPLIKEWAYAGFFFVLSGAVISHAASGDGIKEIAAPLIFVVLTVVSWYLRPLDRTIHY